MSPESRGPMPGDSRLLAEFEGFQEFVQRCSGGRLSENGMFFESAVRALPGAVVEFEARVRGGFRLLRGRGEVVWQRPPGDPGGVAGTAVRFIELDEPSRLLLRKVVQRCRSNGAELFDPEAGPAPKAGREARGGPQDGGRQESSADLVAPAGVRRPATVESARPVAGSAAVKQSRRWPAAVAAGLLGLIAGAGIFYYRAAETVSVAPEGDARGLALEGDARGAAPEVEPEESVAGVLEAYPAAATGFSTAEASGESARQAEALDLPPALEPLTAIDSIFWQEEAGETVVVLVADGLFRSEGYASLRLPGSPPRLLVKIPGVRRPFRPSRLSVDSQHVLRVRTGLHTEPEGSTLHVVADLNGEQVQLQRIEPDGTELRVVFADS